MIGKPNHAIAQGRLKLLAAKKPLQIRFANTLKPKIA